jgi:hypothetical protein
MSPTAKSVSIVLRSFLPGRRLQAERSEPTDLDQGHRSRNLLEFSEICGRVTMNEFAVRNNTNRKTCRSAIRTGKLLVNLDTRIVSVSRRAE